MVFSSLHFLFIFLPIFLIIYYLIQERYRNGLLLIASLIFYAAGDPSYLILIVLSVIVNYILARCIERIRHVPIRKKICFIIALCYNFSMLLFFKYTDFFIENINAYLHYQGSTQSYALLKLALPLGISFYTFQIVSYIIDVYQGCIKAERSLIDLGAYICMFPQLIAGPIVVYTDVHRDLKRRTVTIANLDSGFKTFIVGLGFKVILANRIGILWNDVCTIGFESLSTPLAWLGAFAYSMQLYFDFCGYSLMAIGLGEMLGFTFPANFNHPYIARSVTDFWHRWHMTLGGWFREYVYIPLGGNRRGKLRMFFNLFIVWFLVGFWHGASWNFILWGVLIFLFQFIEKAFLLKLLHAKNMLANLFSHMYMFFYILVSWTIFAISDFGQLRIYLARMFPFFGIGETLYAHDYLKYLITYAPLIVLCILFSTPLPQKLFQRLKDSTVGVGIALGVFWYAVYFLAIGMNNPFLYFRF